jgi:alanine or glycine:cation symporter, AGCS family
METLASWLWNPFLCVIYLEIGILFLFVTRGAAVRGVVDLCRNYWARRNETKSDADFDVSHRHAFLASLAASVGVGNLAGVGTAIHLGGPGALFWMWVSAILGMSFRMSSAYWAVKLARRDVSPELFATPMLYILNLLGSGWKWVATALALVLMVKGMVAANLIQANSVAHAISGEIGVSNFAVSVVLGLAVALVVIGGHKSILRFSTMTAPWMIAAYLLAGWSILLMSPGAALSALGDVFYYAFNPYSIAGGVVGYAVLETLQFGISRGIFSHGSGIGIAPFWQGANRDHPSKSAILAAAVPVVDTLIICTTTGLVVLTAGNWMNVTGAYLTVTSYSEFLGSGGRVLVSICLVIFAYTTIINWAYFAERCFQYLGGENLFRFRVFFVSLTFIGPFIPLRPLWSLGDLLIGSMLILHLVPLTYIIIRHERIMSKDMALEHTSKDTDLL